MATEHETIIKAGDCWDVTHTRKGSFTMRFYRDFDLAADEFIEGRIVKGHAKLMSAENKIIGTGEPLIARASFMRLDRRRDDLATDFDAAL